MIQILKLLLTMKKKEEKIKNKEQNIELKENLP